MLLNHELKVKVRPSARQRMFLTQLSKVFRNSGLPAQSLASNKLNLNDKV
jgi:hypothetical protein